jgi:hypothetical protein
MLFIKKMVIDYRSIKNRICKSPIKCLLDGSKIYPYQAVDKSFLRDEATC